VKKLIFFFIMAQQMEQIDEDQLQLVRQIWLRRNAIVFGGDMVDPTTLYRLAKEQMESWANANQRINNRIMHGGSNHQRDL
jgi:uncharacterized protein YutE (UPF0331/DUF86 family)